MSVPFGRLGGEVAYQQCRHKRHSISEHPRDSDLYKQKEWLRLVEDVDIAWCYVDQRMTRSARNTERCRGLGEGGQTLGQGPGPHGHWNPYSGA